MNRKIVYTILLSILSLLTLVSCTQDYNTIQDSDISVWYTDSTVNLKQEELEFNGLKYEKLTFSGVKNEYVSAQIFIAAFVNVDEYFLEVSDLKSGSNVLESKNFEVYKEHYINITKAQEEASPYEIGYYPDALIPMDAAKKCGVLTINQNKSQGIWVNLQIPKNIEHGKYTGTFKLKVNNLVKNVPVEVTIHNATLKDESTQESLFLLRSDFTMDYGELDGSFEMMRKYYDFLLDYRINAYNIPVESYNDVSSFVESVKEYYNNPKVTTYGLPASTKGNGSVPYNHIAKQQILALAEACTPGTNYLSKLVIKNGDETDYVNSLNGTTYDTDIYNNEHLRLELKSAASIIRENPDGKYDGYLANFATVDEAVEAIENIYIVDPLCYPQTYITAYNDNYDDPQTREAIINKLCNNWCPKTSIMADEYRDLVMETATAYNAKVWWYTANAPRWPTPTYHIDTNPISSQVLSWMQRAYGIKGNLYWSVTSVDEGDDVYSDLSWPSGDGCIVYPGKKFGIDGPLPSMRIMRTRDGLEEYELLGYLEDKYTTFAAEQNIENFDLDSVMNLLYERIFSSVDVFDDVEKFSQVSEELRILLSSDFSKTDLFIANVDKSEDNLKVEFYSKTLITDLPDGFTKLNSTNNLFRYSCETKLTEKETFLEFKSGSKNIKQHVANGYVGITKDVVNINEETVSCEEGSSASVVDGKVKVTLKGAQTSDLTFAPFVKISSDVYDATKFSNDKNVIFKMNLTNTSDEDFTFKLYFYSKDGMKRLAGEYVLVKGRDTQISITLDTIGWKHYANIKYLMFECQNSTQTREFIINDIHLEG